MTPKPWYLSRLHWLGAAQFLAGLVAYASAQPLVVAHPAVASILASASGLLVIALRWLTAVPIEGSPMDQSR